MIACTICINNLCKMNDEFENAITQWQLEKTPENAKRLLDAGNALKCYVPFDEGSISDTNRMEMI